MQGVPSITGPPYFANVTQDGRGQFNWSFAGVPMDKVVRLKVLSQKGLTENKAIADQCNAELIPGLEVLPARCATSPWAAMLRYDERAPFVPVTTTTIRSIWDLYQMQMYYLSQAAYARSVGNHALSKGLIRIIEEDRTESSALERDFNKAFNDFVHSLGVVVDRAKATQEFCSLMWTFTIRYIHMLERRIHACCCLHSGTKDIRCLLTPNALVPEGFPYDVAQEAKDTLDMQAWFQTKQSNGIAEQLVDPEGNPRRDVDKPVVHIDHTSIVRVMQESRNDPGVVWRRFVPWRTLWQYMLFQDFLGLKKLKNEKP